MLNRLFKPPKGFNRTLFLSVFQEAVEKNIKINIADNGQKFALRYFLFDLLKHFLGMGVVFTGLLLIQKTPGVELNVIFIGYFTNLAHI